MGEQIKSITCPVCGKEAEAGALYSRSQLTWLPGEPTWKNRLGAGLFLHGQLKTIGRVEPVGAVYAEGIYCRSCNQIVLPNVNPKHYFPNVKGEK
jgi:hypothetical protein